MPPIVTLQDAAAYLEGLINMERKPRLVGVRQDLTPIRLLLERLGSPEQGLSILHVAGSKGKGSTCLFAEGILRAAGERVGTFTSPHLWRWTERFRVDGSEIDGAVLARVVETIRPHVDALRSSPDTAPTFFDATTAAALLAFAEAGLDRVILEVGLGGRLDSTNAVTPAVTCVTAIELEHTEKLGDTLEAIAFEKAGILKPRVPCVMGRLPAAAAAVVEARARDLDAPLYRLGHEWDVSATPGEGAGGFSLRLHTRDGFEARAEIASPDAHQVDNAALAAACVRIVTGMPDRAFADAVSLGLAETALPGRCEVLRRSPWVVVDGAHTTVSARGLARSLRRFPFDRLHWVISVSEGKSVDEILEALVPGATSVVTTRAEPHRSLEPGELAQRVRRLAPSARVEVLEDPAQALRRAMEGLAREDLLCVAGSIYLVGHARHALRVDGEDS